MSEWLWAPSPESIEQTNVWQFMRTLGFTDREKFLAYSRDRLEEFWEKMAAAIGIEWARPYQTVLDTSRGVEWATWFNGGQLNIAWNALERHARGPRANKIAIISETENGQSREWTFLELNEEASRLANALSALGLVQGDRVALVMPMVGEVAIILYACFKLGFIAVPIFSGFGAGAIAARLRDSGARVVFTADNLERRGKALPLLPKVAGLVETTVVLRYRGLKSELKTGQFWWDDFTQTQSSTCRSLPLDSETPALLLYTSGTTGNPKGVIHTHAGALVQVAKEIYLAFDHKEDDRFFWLTDIGWMMGPWTIIGNHHLGGTILLFDGAPDFPTSDRLWQTIEKHRITAFGVSPTAIRLVMRTSDMQRYEMPTLRLLGSTGEPWDETSYRWFFENVGHRRCPIINISGGTEIIGCFLFPLPIQPLKACTLGSPAPGIATEVVDEDGRPVRGKMGYLVCTKPAPSMTRGVWGNSARYMETYWSKWPGYWNHGDWASVDEDGHWFLHGRADESMNIAGRKVGPAEVEDALIEHAAVSEAAVIGVPDELTGETIVVFVVLRSPATEAELISHLIHTLGPTFRPRGIYAVEELPKTQSGKIVRRLIRQKFLRESVGDLSAVANPGALDQFER